MYGKSYDGVTGLIGVNEQPPGLKAVVSQEPVYDLYRYEYGDGMRRLNSLATPALYDAIDGTPGPLGDDPSYNINGANDTQRPGCKAANWADQASDDDHSSPYWLARDLIPGAKGSSVPLFLTQGLTENNTVSDGTAQYLLNHTGFERAWLGPWDHVRGNEKDEDGRLLMGRKGWFNEVARFYDRFLKGRRPKVRDPLIAVQTNDGKWRAERRWPPADAVGYTSGLLPGSYTDDGDGAADGPGSRGGRLDHLAAPPARRSSRRLRPRDDRRVGAIAQGQPGGRRVRPRPDRHRPADHPPGPHDLLERQSSRSTSGRPTGRSPPATASGCGSPTPTATGGSTCRRAPESPSTAARSRCPFLQAQAH